MATEAPPPNKMKRPNATRVRRSGSAEALAAGIAGTAVGAGTAGAADADGAAAVADAAFAGSGITKHGSVVIGHPLNRIFIIHTQ